jgi:general secretion pathway protein H
MKRSEDGFTLAEMLVVLAVLAIVLAFSLPMVPGSGTQQKLQATAREITSLMSSARSKAIKTGNPTDVVFDRDKKTWATADNGRVVHVGGNIGVEAVTAAHLISGQFIRYRFFPDGGSSGGEVQLSAQDAKATFQLNWLNGATTFSNSTTKAIP